MALGHWEINSDLPPSANLEAEASAERKSMFWNATMSTLRIGCCRNAQSSMYLITGTAALRTVAVVECSGQCFPAAPGVDSTSACAHVQGEGAHTVLPRTIHRLELGYLKPSSCRAVVHLCQPRRMTRLPGPSRLGTSPPPSSCLARLLS